MRKTVFRNARQSSKDFYFEETGDILKFENAYGMTKDANYSYRDKTNGKRQEQAQGGGKI